MRLPWPWRGGWDWFVFLVPIGICGALAVEFGGWLNIAGVIIGWLSVLVFQQRTPNLYEPRHSMATDDPGRNERPVASAVQQKRLEHDNSTAGMSTAERRLFAAIRKLWREEKKFVVVLSSTLGCLLIVAGITLAIVFGGGGNGAETTSQIHREKLIETLELRFGMDRDSLKSRLGQPDGYHRVEVEDPHKTGLTRLAEPNVYETMGYGPSSDKRSVKPPFRGLKGNYRLTLYFENGELKAWERSGR